MQSELALQPAGCERPGIVPVPDLGEKGARRTRRGRPTQPKEWTYQKRRLKHRAPRGRDVRSKKVDRGHEPSSYTDLNQAKRMGETQWKGVRQGATYAVE